MKKLLSIVLILVMALFVVACDKKAENAGEQKEESTETKTDEKMVRLSTMTDEEGRIVGEMMRMILEDNGYTVDAKVGTFNNTTLVRQSIQQNQADISLDYTGRGMMFIKDVDIKNYQKDLQTAFETTKKADEENGIIWLTYAPLNNTDGIAVRKDWADKNNVHSLQELADFVNKGGEMKLAINGENAYAATEELCLPGWEKAYGFKLAENQLALGVTDAQSMASNGTDGVVACHTYTTAGVLESLELVVLTDEKMVSPIYSPAPIASAQIIEKYPELMEIFNPLFETLDAETVIHINKLVSADGRSEIEVAKEYLESKGLLKNK